MPNDDLLEFIQSISGDEHLAVEENLGKGFVRLRTAEAERRQAKHDIRCVEDIVVEMLRNARDANAHSIYVASSREADTRTLVFIDDGDGIPIEMQETIFEPRVTSKLETMVMDTWGVHGRGMALFSIKSNAKSARVMSSAPGLGSALCVSVDLQALPEKADQSTIPKIGPDDEGKIIAISGPHNIIRTIIEFSLEVKGEIDVCYGSPAEIAAALLHTGAQAVDEKDLLFCSDIETLPVSARLAAAGDAVEFARICSDLGLSVSERNAHRILVGQIAPSKPMLSQLLGAVAKPSASSKESDIYRDSRGLKISKEDLEEFSRSLERSFSDLAERYYIELADQPSIRVAKDAITVRFPIEKEL